MSLQPKAIHRLNTIPVKLSVTKFTDLEQMFQKLNGTKNILNSVSSLEKE